MWYTDVVTLLVRLSTCKGLVGLPDIVSLFIICTEFDSNSGTSFFSTVPNNVVLRKYQYYVQSNNKECMKKIFITVLNADIYHRFIKRRPKL